MTTPEPIIYSEVIARMDAGDAKRVLAELVAHLDSQKILNDIAAKNQHTLTLAANATLSQREQAARRCRAHQVAAVAYDSALQHALLKARVANSVRDRRALGDPPADPHRRR